MEIKYNINPRLLFLVMCGLVMTLTSYLMFVYQPLNLIVKKVTSFAPGTLFTSLWADPPYNVLIDVYIFNVTNSVEFLQGKDIKLKFNQIGPYVYQEYLYNNNATFHENGTMTYYPKRYLKFRPDLSIGDPDSDWVKSPNIPLLGIASYLENASMFTNLAFAGISSMANSNPFIDVTISQYLWGYDDRLVSLAHQFIPNWINFNRFGILDRLMALDNATNIVTLNLDPNRVPASQILTEEERQGTYHIHRWNGSPGLKHWGYVDTEGNETVKGNTRCNMVEGSFEGTAFPRNLKENTTLKMYRRAFCRPVPFTYYGKAVSRSGIEGLKYKVDKLFLATPEENPNNACYCVKKSCRKGLGSLAPCYYDLPIAISQPHFLNADPLLLEKFEGINPNENQHGSSFILHPELGVPIEAELGIQINLDIGETKFITKTKSFNGIVLPLFWLKLRIGDILPYINAVLVLGFTVAPVLELVLIYLLGLGGLGLMSAVSAFYILSLRDESNGRLSFRGDYSPVPIISINSPYFSPELRILK